MSGHSKWSQIKRKKEVKDKERGKIFSKIAHLIVLAVADGGGVIDPDLNIRLRMAITRAKEANMPKENITRAIEKATGPEKNLLKEVVYEGFAADGVALMIQVTTDNTNRVFSEIRNILDKCGGKMAGQGAVSYLFKKCGVVSFDKKVNKEDDIFAFADSIGAFDIEEDKDTTIVYFPFENIGKIKSLEESGLSANPAEIDYKPISQVSIVDCAKAKKIIGLVESLESLDDVQKVFVNADIPDEYFIS